MTKKSEPNKKDKSSSVDVYCADDRESELQAIARTYLDPIVLASVTIKEYYKNEPNLDVNALIKDIRSSCDKVHQGNLSRAEDMLVSQAHALDSLFHEMVRRSRLNMGQYFDAAEKYLKLGLKAQSQCRCTIEALAEIKNPKPYIQHNRAHYQQVNNGTAPSEGNNSNNTRTHAHAGEIQKSSNGLLEDKTHEQQWLDAGAPEKTGGNDKELEALGTQHRAKD